MRNTMQFFGIIYCLLWSVGAWAQVQPRVLANPNLKYKVMEVASLSGYYQGNDGGHYYIRQDGNTVYWFGEAANGGWANAMKGVVNGDQIEGEWFDLPKGGAKGKGTITLSISQDRKTLTRTGVTGGFGGSKWTLGQAPASLPGKRAAGYHSNGNVNDLSGVWTGNDKGVYYLRQEGNKIIWFGEQDYTSGVPGFANVAFGTRSGNDIQLDWMDVAKCKMSGKGSLKLKVNNANELEKVEGSGFGGSKWTRPDDVKETWLNTDANTGGITKLVFSDNNAKVEAWGKCSPKDCEWGQVALTATTYQGYHYYAVYKQSVATRTLYFKKTGNDMQVRAIVKYNDNRPLRTDEYTFKKQSNAITTVYTGRAKLNPSLTAAATNKIKIADIYSKQQKINPNGLVLLPTRPKPEDNPKPDDMGTTVQGPNLAVSEDIDVIFTEPSFNYFTEKLNLYRKLYEDINPKSGYFYYLPANYNLDWNRETGEYAFKIYYLSSNADGRGSVIVTAQLTPSIKREDLEYAEQYLSKKLKKTVRMVPMPLRDTPKISFGSFLSLFDVDESSLHPSIPTDFLQPIVVTWRMDSRVEDLVGAMMENFGVNGNIEFSPYGEEEMSNISVPAKLKINDTGTYGKMEYPDAASLLNGFYNAMDYPVVLSSLIVLRENTDKSFTVDYVPLKNYQVEPQMLFSAFDPNERNRILGGGLIKKMWLNYSVKPCSNCNQTVQQKIMGGTSSNRIQHIEIEALTPLESAGASSLKVMIKSKQGDPKGLSEVILPIVKISGDNQTYSGGELFIKEGDSPSFEYRLVLIMPDGTEVLSDWIPRQELFLVIGENTIREHLSLEEK